ncbi:Protein of unknown function [Paenibacillaceae bacterium GAS479]|nr:Protein of unknown function [Paenibacillaceae bacterium GAS479]
MMGPGWGFDFMFTLGPIIFVAIFVLMIATLLFRGIKYMKNATSKNESLFVRIVSKRTEVRGRTNSSPQQMTGNLNTTSMSHTYYYITLEFDNGTRKEYLDVNHLYGLVAEGDSGYAEVKGEWIVAFHRNMNHSQG